MNTLPATEKKRRIALAQNAKLLVLSTLPIEDDTEMGLMMGYKGFLLRVDFSFLHPLIVITFLAELEYPVLPKSLQLLNSLNQQCVLGCAAVNTEANVFSYRAASWLDTELTKRRFHEMLDRCYDEAYRAHSQLSRSLK